MTPSADQGAPAAGAFQAPPAGVQGTRDARSADTDIAVARDVLETEAAAIRGLKDSLDGSFNATVRAILAALGRVIVSGMGKAGIIGEKIAATLASTGTSSFFIHPAAIPAEKSFLLKTAG